MNATDPIRPITTQPLAHYDPVVEDRVTGWFADQRPLVWIPILSQENFPDVPLEMREFAAHFEQDLRWPIAKPEDLLKLPDGITGWLLPADAQDTDIACGVMQGEVYILGVKDKASGRGQTLLGERQTEATA